MTLDDGAESALDKKVIDKWVRETQSTKDFCISCGRETEYEKSTPVSQRKFYVGGEGQLCEPCYRIEYLDRIANGEYNRF